MIFIEMLLLLLGFKADQSKKIISACSFPLFFYVILFFLISSLSPILWLPRIGLYFPWGNNVLNVI